MEGLALPPQWKPCSPTKGSPKPDVSLCLSGSLTLHCSAGETLGSAWVLSCPEGLCWSAWPLMAAELSLSVMPFHLSCLASSSELLALGAHKSQMLSQELL
ncbi:unnamed protein product [Rangifer tarandus platyrhynchus]|uniref:Uncharacterized protein n=1 Tax=Rangifer tarandus platyrhynchus TaxID=3082113 RepID=A0AC59YZ42_RANTA